MTMTVRLDPATERALRTLAKRLRQTRSDVVREAIASYTAARAGGLVEHRPYDQWADVIGLVHLGVRNPAKTTGEQLGDILARNRRARRAR